MHIGFEAGKYEIAGCTFKTQKRGPMDCNHC